MRFNPCPSSDSTRLPSTWQAAYAGLQKGAADLLGSATDSGATGAWCKGRRILEFVNSTAASREAIVANSDQAALVDAHYGGRDIGALILEALRDAGKDLDALTPDDVAPATHLNARGKQATLELAELAGLRRGMRVLDIGSGLGGPARTLASELGCQVTGLELTEEFYRAATMLTTRTGLGGRVTFVHGNALDMPFPDASFEAVWTEQFTMHIEDKARLYTQIHRVLVPGGRFAFREFMAGAVQPIHYPVHWAKDPSISFLRPAAEIRALLTDTGFREVHWEDLTPRVQAAGQQQAAEPGGGAGTIPSGGQLLHGAELQTMRQNQQRNHDEGRVLTVLGVFERQ